MFAGRLYGKPSVDGAASGVVASSVVSAHGVDGRMFCQYSTRCFSVLECFRLPVLH
jgi:hypothetical protein